MKTGSRSVNTNINAEYEYEFQGAKGNLNKSSRGINKKWVWAKLIVLVKVPHTNPFKKNQNNPFKRPDAGFTTLPTNKDLNLDSAMEQTRVVTQLLQCSDAGQVCVRLHGALKAVSEDSVAEEMLVQLSLQRGQVAEQCPVEARRQVAVDDLLCPSQDEHASQARELSCPLLSQNALLLLAETDQV